MNQFESVKTAVTVLEAAKHYGLTPNRSGKVSCIFHEDKTPSMQLNKDYFYCYGCGAHGDVMALVSRIFNLSPAQAAQKLSADFHLEAPKPSLVARIKEMEAHLNQEKRCCRVLREYADTLLRWRRQYAPKDPESEFHPRLVEASTMLDGILYVLERLASAPAEERHKLVDGLLKDDKIELLEQRLQTIKEEEYGIAHLV